MTNVATATYNGLERASSNKLSACQHLFYFTSLQCVIYADRSLIAALVPEAKPFFGFNDAFGGVLGSAFMVGFVIVSPLAALASSDRQKSCTIGCSLLLWSLAMFGCCFALNRWMLLFARILAGVGEAGFCTLAPPIVDDTAPVGRRSIFIAIYYSGIFVGFAMGFVLISPFKDWESGRWTFLIVGLAMIPYSIFVLLAGHRFETTPPVQAIDETEEIVPEESYDGLSMTKGCATLFSNTGFVLLLLGLSASQFSVGGFTFWAPTFLQEELNMDKETLSMVLGIMTMSTGIAGCAAGGLILDKFTLMAERWYGAWRGQRAAVASMFCCALGVLIVPSSCITVLMRTPETFLTFLGLSQLVAFLGSAPIMVAQMESVPTEFRALAMGTSTLVMHLLGDVPSPVVVGALADWFDSLTSAIAILGIWTIWCPICWGFAACVLSKRPESDSTESESPDAADAK